MKKYWNEIVKILKRNCKHDYFGSGSALGNVYRIMTDKWITDTVHKKKPVLLSHWKRFLCLTISGSGLPWKPYFDPNKMKQNVDTAGSIIEVRNVCYLSPYIYCPSSYVFKFKLILYITWTISLFVSHLTSGIDV